MKKQDATRIAQLLNKIAVFERSKHLDDKTKTMLISGVKEEIEEITGQKALELAPSAANTGGEPPAPQPGLDQKKAGK